MVSELPLHDFLKSTDFSNNEFLNKVLDFINNNSKIFGADITKQAITKLPFINGTDDPQSVVVDKPTFMGYGDDIWLVVPDGSGSKAYNMSSILQTGVVKTIKSVKSDANGDVDMVSEGDISVVADQPNNSIKISSSAIDSKISANTASINANDADINKNKSDIAANKSNISANTSSISSNASKISTNTSDIGTLKADVLSNTNTITSISSELTSTTSKADKNKSDIADINSNFIDTITSTDGSITVSKNGNSVNLMTAGGGTQGTVESVIGITPTSAGDVGLENSDTIESVSPTVANKFKLGLKISSDSGNIITSRSDGIYATGGSGSGTVESVAGVSPDTNGDIDIQESNSIKKGTPTENNKFKIDVKLSKSANNALTIRTDGLYSVASGGGTSGLDTINNIAAVNKNIDIEDSTGSLTIAPGSSGVLNTSVKIDPAADNTLTVSSAGLKATGGGSVDPDDFEMVDSVYFDDTYTGSDEDGSYEKPFKTISGAVSEAVDKSTADDKLYTVRARFGASKDVGSGETVVIGDSAGSKLVWVTIDLADHNIKFKTNIEFDAKTEAGKDTITLICNDFSGDINVINPSTVANIADQKFGFNVRLICDSKTVESDKTNFSIDFSGITGIASKRFVKYLEQVKTLVELDKIGTLNNVKAITPNTLTNFEFDASIGINEIDSSQVVSQTPINKVNYFGFTPKADKDSTVYVSVDMDYRGVSKLYTFVVADADFVAERSRDKIIVNTVEAKNVEANDIKADKITMDGELVLDSSTNPISEGGITYDSVDGAILLRTSKDLIKISKASGDDTSKIFMAAKRVTVEDIIETNYEKKSIFIPKSYITEFNANTEVAKKFMDMNAVDLGIRRKDITYDAGTPEEITYAKNDLLEDHDFSANPEFSGLAYVKIEDISNVAVVANSNPDLNLVDISMTVGDGSLTEDEIRDLIKNGFAYTVKGNSGKTYSFIAYDLKTVNTDGSIVLEAFDNTAATTNIPTEDEKPFADLAAVQAEQANFNALYFGDRVDFVFNKSFWKTKNRESLFPQYFPLFIQGKNAPAQQAVVLVPFNSRMLVNKGLYSNTTIGDKAIKASMIPDKFIEFFINKWNILKDDINYQTIGLPLMMGIIDDSKDADKNECREMLPVKIKTSDNNFEIKYWVGANASATNKFYQPNIFGNTKGKWSGIDPKTTLTDSENYISSFAQDCAYINELKIASLALKSYKDTKYDGFIQNFAPVINDNLVVYNISEEIVASFYRDGFLGMSNEVNTEPKGKLSYRLNTPQENIEMLCYKVRGSFLSPFEVRGVDIVRDIEKPVLPKLPRGRFTNDQTDTFNSVLMI